MAGLIGVGRNTLGQAAVGFQQGAGLEASRNAAAQQLKAARQSQRMSMATTGAGLGASFGVNKLMAGGAPVTPINSVPVANAVSVAETLPTVTAANGGMVPELASSALTATGEAGFVSALPAAEIAAVPEIAGGVIPELAATTALEGTTVAGGAAASGTAAGGAAAGGAAAGGASTGVLAGIGAVATPLLIGAGAALLLDSLFDIF